MIVQIEDRVSRFRIILAAKISPTENQTSSLNELDSKNGILWESHQSFNLTKSVT